MQVQPYVHLDTEDALFIERRTVYGCGTVVLTASIYNGVALLEQNPECHTISRELRALIPLTSLEGIERLEAFLAMAKRHMLKHEEQRRQRRVDNLH